MSITWLSPAALTSSGRPILLPTEQELLTLPTIDLHPPSPLPPLLSHLLILTSHRLLLLSPGPTPSSSHSLPLSSFIHAFPPKKPLFSSPRLLLQFSSSPEGVIAAPGHNSQVVNLVFRGGKSDPDAFAGRLWDAVRARAWEQAETETATGSASAVVSAPVRRPVVGVAGILRKEQEMWESTDRTLQDAFQDLNALMGKAKEMVMLAEKMRLKLLSGASSQGSANDEEMGTKQEMQDWLLSVGVQSPVTKESAGAMYHQQLARQLADFVEVPLEKAGGMISLIDVYCVFNRARGTELISPEDLLQACVLWAKLDVPVMLRKFDSGVMVIQSKAYSDDKVFASIASLAQKPDALRTGISPSDAALTLGIAPALAKENLLTAESKGILCRDVSSEGFRFYINLFKEIDPSDIHLVKDGGIFNTWASVVVASG